MTLSTLDITSIKRAVRYIPITLFIILFGYIYELNGHGVFSYFMIYAFAPLLIGEIIFWLVHGVVFSSFHFCRGFINLWGAAIATLTVGFIFTGILDIYGTSSKWEMIYWIAGLILAIAALVLQIINKDIEKL